MLEYFQHAYAAHQSQIQILIRSYFSLNPTPYTMYLLYRIQFFTRLS